MTKEDEPKRVQDMTVKELRALPWRANWADVVECYSLVVLPGYSRPLHDSGYRLLDFVAVGEDGVPICRLSGCSDILHIDGIGGRRYSAPSGYTKREFPPAWSIDCLPKSGLLHLFVSHAMLVCEAAVSSFEVYAVEDPDAE